MEMVDSVRLGNHPDDPSHSSRTSSTRSTLPDEVLSIIFCHLIHSNQQVEQEYQGKGKEKGKQKETQPKSINSRLNCRSSDLHIPSTKAIALISRRYHSLSCQLLYHTVYLDSTIKLARFHRAISSRPNLGNLVKNLFVGHLTLSRLLPDFTSQTDDPILLQIYSKLFPNANIEIQSDSADPDQRQDQSSLSLIDGRIGLDSAGPNLINPGLDSQDRNIGIDEWVNRIWLIQMGREMYAEEEKQRQAGEGKLVGDQEEQKIQHGLPDDPADYGDSKVYLDPLPSRPSPNESIPNRESRDSTSYSIDKDPTFLSRLLSYSSSPERDSISNFNHPVLFSRSNASELILGPTFHPEPNFNANLNDPQDGEADQGFQALLANQNQNQNQNVGSSHHDVSASTLFGRTLPSGGRRLGLTDVPVSSNPNPSDSQHTIGSLMSLTRSLISMCPNIVNLALNGFFESVVADERGCAGLLNIHSLSLGPPPPHWFQPLRFGGPSHSIFSKVKILHISGCMLFQSEINSLSGLDGSLPHLQKLIWSLKSPYAVDHETGLVETVKCLLAFQDGNEEDVGSDDNESDEDMTDEWLKSQDPEREGSDEEDWEEMADQENRNPKQPLAISTSSSSSSSAIDDRTSHSRARIGVPFLHAILHPLDVEDFRRSAGKSLRNHLRLQLESCNGINIDLPVYDSTPNSSLDKMDPNGFRFFGINPLFSALDYETLKSFQESKLFFQGESLKKDHGDYLAYSDGVRTKLSFEVEVKRKRRIRKKRRNRVNSVGAGRSGKAATSRNHQQQDQLHQAEVATSSQNDLDETILRTQSSPEASAMGD